MARLLVVRHCEVPGRSPIFSTQSTASELICAEVDGSSALRAEAVHNSRFHVLSWPNWHFEPHTPPLRISWRAGSVGWRVSSRFCLTQFAADHLVGKTRLFIAVYLAGACESKRSSKLRRGAVFAPILLNDLFPMREVRNANRLNTACDVVRRDFDNIVNGVTYSPSGRVSLTSGPLMHPNT